MTATDTTDTETVESLPSRPLLPTEAEEILRGPGIEAVHVPMLPGVPPGATIIIDRGDDTVTLGFHPEEREWRVVNRRERLTED